MQAPVGDLDRTDAAARVATGADLGGGRRIEALLGDQRAQLVAEELARERVPGDARDLDVVSRAPMLLAPQPRDKAMADPPSSAIVQAGPPSDGAPAPDKSRASRKAAKVSWGKRPR
ncbi:MAG: hypothetical protein R3E48_22045 [Burkholderiaceae bacterium]